MQDQSSLFSLSIDPVTKAHLTETAKWARFLAIVGFVFLLLMIAVGIYSSITISRFEDEYQDMGMSGTSGLWSSAGAGVAVMYFIMALVTFFPLLFLLRFANNMQAALAGNDQASLNNSFQNLKVCFRYLGIVTVISLVLMALTLIFGIAGLALSS